MATSNLSIANNNDTYHGIYPSVLKKIDRVDVSTIPFQVYKTWTAVSGSSTSSMLPLQGIYSDPDYLPALGSELTFNDLANIDGSLQTITYYSINHLFYKYKTSPMKSYGPTDLTKISKYLYQSASVLSFPQIKIGEGIKPGSFSFTGSTVNLASDRYSNIYDVAFDTASIVSDCKFYEGFNEYFNESILKQNTYYGNLTAATGIPTTTGATLPIGYAANFNLSSATIVSNESVPGYYDRDHDYAISFFVSASNTGTREQLLIVKSGTRKPYYIAVQPNKKIIFYIVGASPEAAVNAYIDPTKIKHVAVTGSTAVSSSWNHVVCQKSGSYMQIYVNGVLETSTDQSLLKVPISPVSESMRIDSPGDIYVGGWKTPSSNNYNGKLDEIRIYNKSLTATEVGYIADRSEGGTMLQTNVVGNVFSKQGLAVISSPDYRYADIIKQPFTSSYKSTKTIYELNVLAKLDAGDFNMSLNHTLTNDDDVTYRNFVSGSDFAPYITTIGLYDDAGQLLAIGKLAQPIRKRNDVDMNFVIRVDLDKDTK